MSRPRPARKPVTAPAAGLLYSPSATTTRSTRSGAAPRGQGSLFTTVSWSTSAVTTPAADKRARLMCGSRIGGWRSSCQPPVLGLRLTDDAGDALALAVLVGVGAGFGLGGRTENLGSWRGGTTTMPTTFSAVRSA